MRKLVYTTFITNNHDSFHLWWNENLVKHWKVSKYYDQDCLKNFLLDLMSLLGVPIFLKSHFLAEIHFIFLKTHPRYNFKGFQYKIWIQWKDRKSSYQVKQILSLPCKFATPILDEKYVKSLRITKIVKQIKFEGDCGELEAKYCFQRQSWPKHMRQTLVLVRNSTLREKFNFNFWIVFASIDKISILGRRLGTRL